MGIVQARDRQLLYSGMAPLVLKESHFLWSCEEGKTADDVTVTSLVVSFPLLPPPFLFPGQEVRFTMSSCFLRTQSS